MQESAPTFETLPQLAGRELGISEWTTVGQDRIDQFAACTGDRQWIHVDTERARRESPFRTTIAHGYLTLSIVAALAQEVAALPENTQAAINYGLDRVRFTAPVRAGARVRLRARLLSVDKVGPGQYLMKVENIVEVEGDERPAVTAETLTMLYEKRKKKAV